MDTFEAFAIAHGMVAHIIDKVPKEPLHNPYPQHAMQSRPFVLVQTKATLY